MSEEKKTVKLNEEELEQVNGGLGFATRNCPNCGAPVAVKYVQQGPFKVITSGQCSCGYNFAK